MLTGIEQGIQLCDFHKYEGHPTHVQEAKYENRNNLFVKCKKNADFFPSRLQLHGFNTMSVDVKSYWRLLIDEVLNPFYLFEIFSCVVWTVDDYIYYAGCIFVVSIISVGVALYEIRRVIPFISYFLFDFLIHFPNLYQQSETLKHMTAAHISSMVTVCRGGDGILLLSL